jgi:hypothetical protein
MRRLIVCLALAPVCAFGALVLGTGTAVAASEACPTQGLIFETEIREGQDFVADPRPIGCIAPGDTVTDERILWGDGTSTALKPWQVASGTESDGDQRLELHAAHLTHRYGAANCPASRQLRYRCRAGYRMVLAATDLTTGKTVESEPRFVYVLAARDRVIIGRVVDAGHEQEVSGRIVCGGERRASELVVSVAWGATRRETIHLHGTARVFRFAARHLRRGKGPRYVTVTVRDRLGLTVSSTTRVLR